MIGPDEFRFLNRSGVLAEVGWSGDQREKLWRYNQHYFDDLNARGARARTHWHQSLLKDWVEKNPPGQGVGWDPYPTSVRIVNWIKWSLSGNRLPEECLHSLAVQACWLYDRLEYHLLGNHLLVNAKALLFAGVYFKGAEADKWKRKGQELLAWQLVEQVLRDGGHYERSPMYHNLVLEDVLDLINLFNAYRNEVPRPWTETARHMLEWSQVMRHPDGEVPFFNDTAVGVAPLPEELDAYAKSLGIDVAETPFPSKCLIDSGYCRLEKGPAVLFLDVGALGPDYQPGHGHADTLSFELSLRGRRLLVNSGTSTYVHGPERLWQRGTAAHNTVVVDGCDSSEVWSSFRVARRARVRNISYEKMEGEILVSAEHDGYERLPQSVVHRRTWRLGKDGLSIRDCMKGHGRHLVEVYYYFHPDVSLSLDGRVIVARWRNSMEKVAELSVDEKLEVSIEDAEYYPVFGQAVSNQRVVCTAHMEFPVSLVNEITWLVGAGAGGQ